MGKDCCNWPTPIKQYSKFSVLISDRTAVNGTHNINSYSMIGNGLFTDGSIDLNTGIWSVISSGRYQISAQITGIFTGSTGSGMVLNLIDMDSNTIYSQIPFTSSYGLTAVATLSTYLSFNATQRMRLQIVNNTGQTFTLGGGNNAQLFLSVNQN